MQLRGGGGEADGSDFSLLSFFLQHVDIVDFTPSLFFKYLDGGDFTSLL